MPTVRNAQQQDAQEQRGRCVLGALRAGMQKRSVLDLQDSPAQLHSCMLQESCWRCCGCLDAVRMCVLGLCWRARMLLLQAVC
jgi:hypothetical protein